MIYTGSYYNFKSKLYNTYSISGDRGKMANYDGKCYPKLAPKKDFWQVWHNNIGKISEEENLKYYIREYYLQVLSKLDIDEVYRELNNSILLCYEDVDEFCHREIVASWFEIFLGEEVPEVKPAKYMPTIINVKRTERYKFIKDYLKEVIKSNNDMKGFTSFTAYHLYEKSEKLQARAEQLEKLKNKDSEYVRREACRIRCDAEIAECEYKILVNKKNKQ